MLALVAGTGRLPEVLVEALPTRPLVAAVRGHEPAIAADLEFRLEALSSFLDDLTSRGVTEVVFAGAVCRPQVDMDAIEPATAPFVPRIVQALTQGDDAALRELLAIFEESGFAIRAAHDLWPDLLPPAGILTVAQPRAGAEAEASRGTAILDALGAADCGQACVVHRGQALALEGVFGTDWMLQSLTRRPDGTGGILMKGPKPGQDRRVDLPTIGPATIAAAATAGLDGVVIEASGVIVLDREDTVAAADAHGLFLWVR